jgi:hypothetical protein
MRLRAADHAAPWPNATVVDGRYRVEAALGKGGVAQVYRVCDTSRSTQLALKRVSLEAPRRVASLFELEYRTLASLRHPHTVQVYEFGRDDSSAYYTMELLEGGDLRDAAPMHWRQVCGVLRDAALALGVLHARQLVHRDVSPRNLWRALDGRVKLIDFGALAEFGQGEDLIGTPPLIPPESYNSRQLDQRADLYSLGATGYYLLSGFHAYPARELQELPDLWRRPILPPSAAVATLARPEFERMPAELDALLLGLLHHNPLARPSSTAELIDRIDTLLAGATHVPRDSPELHLANSAFVGRVRERRRLRRQLRLSLRMHGQAAVIQAEPGMGRSRLLHELALDARVADAVTLHVDAESYPGLFGTAGALAVRLLDAMPDHARRAAQPHAPTLAHASSQVRDRLNVRAEQSPDVAGELRIRVQRAMCDWFLQVSAKRPLVVLVDGLERVDDASSAFLLALAHACKGARMFLACTLAHDSTRRPTAAERAIVGASLRTLISPLSDPEALALLQSVFGGAVHLTRLASRLHHVTRGSPGHILELAGQLIRSESIGFANGTWVLPQELPDALISSSREQALAAKLARLRGPARDLARILSVQSGAIAPALCQALSGKAGPPLAQLLAAVCEHEIMTRDADGVRFTQDTFRETLFSELDTDERQRAQRILGQYLLGLPGEDPLDRLRAGVHLLDSGDLAGVSLVTAASTQITLREPDRLAPACPVMERACVLMREAGRPDHELIAVLAPLAIAGYFADRKYAVRYGDEALAALQRVLGLDLARRLSPRFGRKLGMASALADVTARYLWKYRGTPAPNLQDALMLFFMAASTLAASSALVYDYDSTRRAADVLEAFTALGTNHAVGFSYHVCSGLATAVRDTFGETHERWRTTCELLESKKPIPGLPDNLRVRYLSGLLFAMGIMDSQRDDDRSLQMAERLDRMGVALYPMSTDQLRAMYYAHQGNADLYAHYRERSEHRAIQQGAIWQNETWTLLVETIVSHRHHNAMALKRVSEQLQIASKVVPTLAVFAERSRGAYLLLRERHTQALPWLERCLEEPIRHNFGWGRSHGLLARAYNELGRYADARKACERVLDVFTPADLAFPGLTLLVQTELLVAQAGLGDIARAQWGLHMLIDQHEPNRGPLTNGELHETGIRIAVLARDEKRATDHCRDMMRWYRTTHIPSLIQHCEAVVARAAHAFGRSIAPGAQLTQIPADTNTTALARIRLQATEHHDLAEFAETALQILGEHAGGATRGYFYVVESDATSMQVARLGQEALSGAAEIWFKQRILESLEDVTTAVLTSMAVTGPVDHDLFVEDGWHYRFVALFNDGGTAKEAMAALLIASTRAAPPMLPAELVSALTRALQSALMREHASSTRSVGDVTA